MGDDGIIRNFDTGATRDTGEGKLLFDKFLSSTVLRQFAKFMNMNRLQSDGKLRDGDNWQKGIPQENYMESAFRHFMDWWDYHRKLSPQDRAGDVEGIGALCGLMFNVMGWMHEWLKENEPIDFDGAEPTFEMAERQQNTKEVTKPVANQSCETCRCQQCEDGILHVHSGPPAITGDFQDPKPNSKIYEGCDVEDVMQCYECEILNECFCDALEPSTPVENMSLTYKAEKIIERIQQ